MATPKRSDEPIPKEYLASLGIGMAPPDSPVYKEPLTLIVMRRQVPPRTRTARRSGGAAPSDPGGEDTGTRDP